jgi:hypothetical protein
VAGIISKKGDAMLERIKQQDKSSVKDVRRAMIDDS